MLNSGSTLIIVSSQKVREINYVVKQILWINTVLTEEAWLKHEEVLGKDLPDYPINSTLGIFIQKRKNQAKLMLNIAQKQRSETAY